MTSTTTPRPPVHQVPEVADDTARAARRRQRRHTLEALAFISPWLIGLAVFTAGPMLASLWLSFTQYDLIESPTWVGMDNYAEALVDPTLHIAMRNTVLFTVLSVPASVVLSLALAVLLRQAHRRTAGFFRTVFYLPAVTPPVAVGVLFLLILNGQVGLLNRVLGWIGIDGPNWTTDPAWILPGIVVMSLWSLGTSVVILYAALLNEPVDLREAAVLDGAGPWTTFRHVTVPTISPALFFVTVVNTIAALQVFTEVYTMYFGSQASSASDAALLYVVYLFQQAFQYLNMGYASAMAWILFLVVLAITLVQLKVGNRLVYYEGGDR
jgi:multiple sugar transport system permease protein